MKNYLTHIVEFIISFAIVTIMYFTFSLRPEIIAAMLIALVFIWSARYGLVVFVTSVSIFEITLLVIIKNLPNEAMINANTLSIFTIIVGLIVGIIGEILNKKIKDLNNEKKKLELENQRLLEAVNEMKVVLSQLQLRIYFEGEGLIVLLERLRELEILDVDEIFTRAVEIIAQFFELETLHLYHLEGNFLRYVAGIGNKKLPNAFEISKSKVIEDALQNGYSTLPKIILKSDIDAFEPWFAVAIGERGSAFGVFVVEEVSQEKFSETLVKYINAVSGWLYANTRTVLEQERAFESIYKKEDGTWDEVYYLKKKDVFEKRKEKFGIPYEEMCVSYKPEFHESIVRTFRKSDVLTAIYSEDKIILKVLLPVCDAQGKRTVIERLASKYEIEEC